MFRYRFGDLPVWDDTIIAHILFSVIGNLLSTFYYNCRLVSFRVDIIFDNTIIKRAFLRVNSILLPFLCHHSAKVQTRLG